MEGFPSVVHAPLAADSRPGADAPPDGGALDLLARWLELGETERRAFVAIAEELSESTGLIERSTVDLSARFRELTAAAQAQTSRVERIAEIAKTVTVSGRAVPLAEATRLVEIALAHAIDTLGQVSEQAGRMVAVLNEVTAEVAGAEQCVARIGTINKQARFVALNAAIEAQRAEGSGGTFKVIAHELKELSRETDETSRMVGERIAAVARGVRGAHAELEAIAGIDGATQARTRQELNAVLSGIVTQNDALSSVLAEALEASAEIAGTVSMLVTGAQFQDRTTQHLDHLREVVCTLGEATERLRRESLEAVPLLREEASIDHALLQRMLDRQSLSSVRQRFLARIRDDSDAPEDDSDAGDIELF
ncbi:methyl-accepting chemotaxis protein [Muricoccus pecuniae]|uniref:Methyl-accepting chemotaxis protein n=1 Tax=Muricoccus pecuniae TaxID=693023 RepID=A0A840YM65_9PROT|nr:methyl-accepting chemotaxis protein [Roseomonas pecuniae]MBB5695634.1 methyl-accepting chemotaxis protein [Roseomonas pecuniae]